MPLLVYLAATALLAPQEDAVLLKNKKVLLGTVLERGEETVRFNPYRSAQREMIWGLEEIPTKQIKEILPGRPAVERVRMGLSSTATTLEELKALLLLCEKEKLKDERLLVLEQALRVDPSDAEVIASYGKTASEKFLRSDPTANAELRAALQEYLTLADATERRARIALITKNFALHWPAVLFERAYRSAQQARGRTDDKPLTLHGDEIKGVYTLFVPKSYDPFRPTPLLIGLHGGGPGGRDNELVVGSGTAAMIFYQAHAERLGWIVACPTALRAPWSTSPNDPWLRALLEELKLSFHIDLNRIYLTGHSMGGFGTWHFGPKYCEEWAAIGPLSGGGSNGFAKLLETQTYVYLYHGADDAVVGVGDSRNAANALRNGGNDFVYSELPNSGHGFPPNIQQELFATFEHKRRSLKGKSLSREESSFLVKESKDEERFFGPLFPKSSASSEVRSKDLIAALSQGGGAGERAALQLIELADPSTSAPLIALLKNRKAPGDARALAARVLGHVGDESALKTLAATACEADIAIYHTSVEALGRLSGPERAEHVVEALKSLTHYFDSRRRGADQMSYSDWDPLLRELAFGLQVLESIDAAQGNTVLDSSVADKRVKELGNSLVNIVLLKRWQVPHEERVRQDPELARTVLLDALLASLQRCGKEASAPTIEALAEHYRDTKHAEKIRAALK